jgi:phage tail protein X
MDKALDIQPPMPPEFEAPPGVTITDPIWIALGKPATPRVIISTQGDWWDTIAMRAYGMKRGNERLMYRLLEANYPLRDVSNFPAGLAVIVPDREIEIEIPLVPWKSAAVGPAK